MGFFGRSSPDGNGDVSGPLHHAVKFTLEDVRGNLSVPPEIRKLGHVIGWFQTLLIGVG